MKYQNSRSVAYTIYYFFIIENFDNSENHDTNFALLEENHFILVQ